MRQPFGAESASLEDVSESDLLRVADALVQVIERIAVVEVGRVNNVPGSAELIGEREESRRLALSVMEEEDLGDASLLPRSEIAKTGNRVSGGAVSLRAARA